MAPSPSSGRLGIIVGSSLPPSALPGRRELVEVSPGPDGARRTVTVLDGGSVVLLARHGLDRHVVPHLIDHAAHLTALANAGVDRVVAFSSVGSLRLDWPVGSVVLADDLFALGHAPTIHDDQRGHVVPALDRAWREEVVSILDPTGIALEVGGTYAQTSGPRFETPAEVRFLATVADMVGMTAASEALLAAEMGIPLAIVAVVDNLANGLAHGHLSVEEFHDGVAVNQPMVTRLLDRLMDHNGA